MKRYAIVLAAGKGTRMKSKREDISKVSFPILGRPLVKYVLEALKPLDMDKIVDVYETVQDYTVTNMGSGLIEKLAEKVQSYKELELVQFDGIHDTSDIHMKFYVDEQNKQNVILDLFYSPVWD